MMREKIGRIEYQDHFLTRWMVKWYSDWKSSPKVLAYLSVFSIFSSDFQIVLKGCVWMSVCFGTFHIHCHQSRCPGLHTVTLHVHTHILPQSQKTVIILYHKSVTHTSWSTQRRNIQFISKSNICFIDIHVDVSISFCI